MMRRASVLCRGWLLAGCLAASCARDGDENLGLVEPRPPAKAEVGKLSDPQVLLQVAAVPAQELWRRLGALKAESRTSWDITPPTGGRDGYEAQRVTMEEASQFAWDKAGGLRALHSNDHGYGTEAVLVGGQLYVRMREGPFVRRKPEGDEVQRIVQSADNGTGLLGALWPHLEASVKPATGPVGGRPALQVTLRKRAQPLRVPPQTETGKGWRQFTRVDELTGTAVVDRDQAVLLSLDLSAVLHGPRSTGARHDKDQDVQVKVHHRQAITGLGSVGPLIEPIEPPPEWMASPIRPRPQLDRQELLDGLDTRGGPR